MRTVRGLITCTTSCTCTSTCIISKWLWWLDVFMYTCECAFKKKTLKICITIMQKYMINKDNTLNGMCIICTHSCYILVTHTLHECIVTPSRNTSRTLVHSTMKTGHRSKSSSGYELHNRKCGNAFLRGFTIVMKLSIICHS